VGRCLPARRGSAYNARSRSVRSNTTNAREKEIKAVDNKNQWLTFHHLILFLQFSNNIFIFLFLMIRYPEKVAPVEIWPFPELQAFRSNLAKISTRTEDATLAVLLRQWVDFANITDPV
jgi:hypothetical protein